MTSRTCVIGGTGFLGSHIVDALLAQGRKTIVYSRSAERFRAPLDRVRTVTGDFAKGENLDDALRGVDTVIHSLTTMTVHTSNADMAGDIQTNLLATVRLLEKCVEHGVTRIVFLSSAAVYGPTQVHPTPETTPPNPMSSYGAVKLAIEHYLSVFSALHGLQYCALRLANPYGPRQDPRTKQGVIAIFAGQALTGETITLNGDGSAERDFIHATDCAQAVLAAAHGDAKNYVANVGSGTGVSLNAIIDAIDSTLSTPTQVTRTAARTDEVSRSVLDSTKFNTLTGWTPKMDLRTGIADVMDWIRSADL